MVNYLVWCPEQDETQEDAFSVEAYSPGHAAREWAEHEDSYGAEYSIVSQRWEPVVIVMGPDGLKTRWKVTGESVPEYFSTRN